MKITNLFAAVAAVAMSAAPVAAQTANPASSLSVSKSVRSGVATKGKSRIGGGIGLVALIFVAGIVAIPVIAVIKDDNDSDSN